ncbi:MAG: flavodoxin family protein [Clostridia bacterium]|nr:flavodoxin family protein [Clostridia bacterium]
MKVLMLNGSPHEHGCTYTALSVIAEELKNQGVESEIVWIGTKPVRGCIGCGACRNNGDKCVFSDDVLVSIAQKAKDADGYIFGAPVHYASPNGATIAVLDRLFMSTGKYMQFKPAASIVSARRAGTTASYDALNKYIGINNMLQVPSTYWNMVHGNSAEEVLKDEEGVCIMKAIASNMAWLLKLLQKAKNTELEKPILIPKVKTNFIR